MEDRIPPAVIFRVYFLYANGRDTLRQIAVHEGISIYQANWCISAYLRNGCR
jgi:hypothetical protein